MFTRKIIVYQKYANKPIILTDTSNTSQDKVQQSILDSFKSDKISILETSNDVLFFRPSEVQSILVTKPDSENIIPELEKKKYYDKLELEKK
jgi:hypothetical protein